jgi:DNA-binding phage protein
LEILMSRKHGAGVRDHFAIAYLNVMMEEADQDELVAALCRLARMGGRSRVVQSRLVEKIELNAQALYRALCLRSNPELRSAAALLKTLGVRLAIQPTGRRPHRPGEGRALPGRERSVTWSGAGMAPRAGRRTGSVC